MRDFSYSRAGSLAEAQALAGEPGAMLLAGGTTLLDLAKCGVAQPERVVDISHLAGLDEVDVDIDGAVIGALAKMSFVAEHAGIQHDFPAVAQSLHLCRLGADRATWRRSAAI